jgi:hypothetical protein
MHDVKLDLNDGEVTSQFISFNFDYNLQQCHEIHGNDYEKFFHVYGIFYDHLIGERPAVIPRSLLSPIYVDLSCAVQEMLQDEADGIAAVAVNMALCVTLRIIKP